MSLAGDKRRAGLSSRDPLSQNDIFKGKKSPESTYSSKAICSILPAKKGLRLLWTNKGNILAQMEMLGNALHMLALKG